jgi:hypothetical protein
VVELLVVTAAALLLATVCGQALAAYHQAYRAAVMRIDHTQQADFALALISAELESRIDGSQGLGCPPVGLQVTEVRMEFTANLFDRETSVKDTVPAGAAEVVVESTSDFDVGDMVRLTDVGAVGDPSDDSAQCVRIIRISGNHLVLASALVRSFLNGSPVTLLNSVLYRLDERGRLMRTQDGGTQRIADNLVGLTFGVEGQYLTIQLTMSDRSTRTRSLVLERHL